MSAAIQAIVSEVADNWPVLVYMLMTGAFSILFLRERRSEMQIVKAMGVSLQEEICLRIERLELALGTSSPATMREAKPFSHPVESVSK